MTDLRSDIAALTAALSDRYGLERELGRGGMATVYLAHDLKHDRSVALKVLHPELAATLGPERFQREIRFAARLQHPHILTVLDSGEAAGQLWFTMPYVEGESLRERLRHERQLSIDDALRITREVAQALQCAHEHGVIHRDVKPENILLTKDGNTLVADFGVARALGGDEALTQTGLAVGTPAYMSPEQAAGERELDARTDVYALGCLLYEMLAGEPPFTGPTTQAVIAKRFNTAPTPVRITRPEVPEEVDQAVLRALARTPADRFASAADLARALRGSGFTTPAGTAATIASPAKPRRWYRRALAVGFGVAMAVGAGVIWLKGRAPTPAAADASAFAVLPFRAVGPGLDLWREGLVDLLAINLDGAGGLRAIAPRTVLSRWHRDVGDDEPDQQGALGVARAVGARYALTGSIIGGGSTLRVAVELLDAGTGSVEGRAQVEGPTDSIPALVDRLSLDLVRSGIPDRGGTRVPLDLRAATTRSLPALKHLLTGEQFFRRGRAREALESYREAIKADSTFALAAYRLAVVEAWTGSPHDVGGTPAEALSRLQPLLDRLPRREALVARTLPLLNAGELSAVPVLEHLVRDNPSDAEAWFQYGDALFHLGGAAGRPREAFREALRRATALDPAFAPAYLHLAEDAFDRGDSAEVRRLVSAVQRIDPGSPRTTGLAMAEASVWGDSAARATVRAALDTAPGLALLTAKHALDLTPGLLEPTRLFAQALIEQPRHEAWLRGAGYGGMAWAYRAVGRHREAREAFRRAMPLWGFPEEDSRITSALHDIFDFLQGLPDSARAGTSHRYLSSLPDTLNDPELMGRYAAAYGRWAEVERWIKVTEWQVQRAIADGDSIRARRRREDGRVLRAFVVEGRGEKGAVLRALAAGIDGYGQPPYDDNAIQLRLELARRLLAAGEFRDAYRHLNSFDIGTYLISVSPGLVELHRGQAAEGLGNVELAKTHYGNVTEWWRDCDPELLPIREVARQALARLTAEPGTR